MSKQGLYGTIGFVLIVLAIGIVGGIENGEPLSNFFYAVASMIGSGVAFCKGGLMK